jgi:extracellular elastinolytic metalloproteinase
MKKFLLLSVILACFFVSKAQVSENDRNIALQLVNSHKTVIGLSDADGNNFKVSDSYFSKTSGLRHVYLQQTFLDIPVYNQIQVLAFKNDSLVSNMGGRIAGIEKQINVSSGIPSVSAEMAVRAAIADRKLEVSGFAIMISQKENGRKIEFNNMGVSRENITAELMWSPDPITKTVQLAWQVYIIPKTTSDYWLVRVDATNKNILGVDNLTVYDRWDNGSDYVSKLKNEKKAINFFEPRTSDNLKEEETTTSPDIVNGATYRVVRFPAESPSHPGGTPGLISDPWTAAPGNATALKWHSTAPSGSDYNITRGNNVWAKEDRAGNNSNTGLPATSTTSPDPLTFNFTPNFTMDPTQTTPVPNQQFNITNLFYWINIFHDVTYLYGFDEPAGNFQSNNNGQGGIGNDWVYGDAQDGSGTNNANFSTPNDGGNGRMQMFLWSGVPNFVVNTPAPIAGPYTAVEGAMSTNNLLINVGPRTGQVVYYNDDAPGNTHYACLPPANSITGKIALIDRGGSGAVCPTPVAFTVKVKNAQDAGAIAVIMVNNVPGAPITMGGTDNTIIIPAVMISQSDGAIIAAQLGNNVNVTMSGGPSIDGDADNGVIVHEYGHGLSNRLTGGPGNSSCLNNAEQAGEGWSDYYGLMFTQDWSTSNVNTGFNSPRGIGTYVIGQSPSGGGIRSQPYCTNFAINNQVYAATIPAESHSRGEIWCATLWDMTWNIIQQTNTISSSIYNSTSSGGNCIAFKLVTEAMKLQPCSPGFIDGRNAILQADAALYGGQYECSIREAFRRRGMGPLASQGSSGSVTDQTPDFTSPAVNISAQPQNVSVCAGGSTTFSVTATVNTGATPTYQWQVSTDGGATYSNIAGATSSTYTLNGITIGMNNNRYRCVVSGKCATSVNSNGAILTVSGSVSITQQPSNAAVCETANTSFTVTVSGAGINYQWQLSTDGGATYNNVNNGGIYSGATTATLSLTGVTASLNNNRYRAVVSSSGCAVPVNSTAAILTVNLQAAITSQPTDVSLCSGSSNTFCVTAIGTNLTYQWQSAPTCTSPWSDIPAATSSCLTINGVVTTSYRCRVTGTACGNTVTSNCATFTVGTPAGIVTQPVSTTICETGNSSFSVTGSGVGTINYQWQVSTDGGTTYSNVVNGGVYSGATTATLTLTGVTFSLNANRYRAVLSNAICTAPATSNAAILTVNARPTVTLSASPYTKLLPGLLTTITATILPSASGFTISWFRNGTQIPGITGTTYIADISKLGDYRVNIVNTVTGCNNQSTLLTISDSASSRLFIYPSPNDGTFKVAYYNSGGLSTKRTIAIFDSKGSEVYYRQFDISGGYTLLDIDMRTANTGIYNVVVGDANGKKLATGKVHVR